LSKREGDGDVLLKATWQEFCGLSGMVSERFYALMDPDATGKIEKPKFLNIITQVFLSDLEAK
jgi:hypothetical protein